MNRSEMIRRMLAHAAAAKALRTMLEREAETEVNDEGTRPTWSIPGVVTAYAAVEHDAAVVADPEAFMDYLEQHFPTEVVRREVREVRAPKWLADLLEEWVALGPAPLPEGSLPDEPPGVRTPDGTVVPGLKFRYGGGFKSLTVKPDSTAARRLSAAAIRYARGDAGLDTLQGALLPASRELEE